MTARRVVAVFLVFVAAATVAAQAPMLTTRTEVVRVDVSVRRGRSPG